MSLVTQTAQGTALSITSNILAQVIASYKDNTPLTINLSPVYKFALFSIISNPPNILWQQLLEDLFPTNVPTRKLSPKSEKPTSATRMSKRNVALKFALDMTIGAALNTIMFLGFMAYMNAGPKQDVWAAVEGDVRKKFWPLIVDGLKLWPFVSLCSFLFVPVDKRVLMGALVGVGWNIYLSMLVG